MSAGTTVDQVRQVLMNELGLTREYVRQEIGKIVEREVKVMTQRMLNEGIIERLVAAEFGKYVRESHWDATAMRKLVVAAAEKQMRQFVESSLELSIMLKRTP